jgi:hypothetical protein
MIIIVSSARHLKKKLCFIYSLTAASVNGAGDSTLNGTPHCPQMQGLISIPKIFREVLIIATWTIWCHQNKIFREDPIPSSKMGPETGRAITVDVGHEDDRGLAVARAHRSYRRPLSPPAGFSRGRLSRTASLPFHW